MKCVAIAIVIAAFLYSDAAYVAKYGSDYDGAGVAALILVALGILFFTMLFAEGENIL